MTAGKNCVSSPLPPANSAKSNLQGAQVFRVSVHLVQTLATHFKTSHRDAPAAWTPHMEFLVLKNSQVLEGLCVHLTHFHYFYFDKGNEQSVTPGEVNGHKFYRFGSNGKQKNFGEKP